MLRNMKKLGVLITILEDQGSSCFIRMNSGMQYTELGYYRSQSLSFLLGKFLHQTSKISPAKLSIDPALITFLSEDPDVS